LNGNGNETTDEVGCDDRRREYLFPPYNGVRVAALTRRARTRSGETVVVPARIPELELGAI
jgi:hypothetical protein